MKIASGRTKEPDEFSIEGVRFGYHSQLIVLLKPQPQNRNYGEGSRSKARTNPAVLEIDLQELQTLVQACVGELNACRRVLRERGLFDEIEKEKKRESIERELAVQT